MVDSCGLSSPRASALRKARWWLLGAAALGISASVAACTVTTDSGSGGSGKLGSLCSGPGDCSSNSCFMYNPNEQNIKGQCTSSCTKDSDCGSGAACAIDSSSGMFCAQICTSSSQCAGGVPCVFNVAAGTGVCKPVVSSLCSDVTSSGDACLACAGASCCQQLKACAADYSCGAAFLGSSTSTGAAYDALNQCLMTPCASCFGSAGDDGGTD
jgi:hypothetical protein